MFLGFIGVSKGQTFSKVDLFRMLNSQNTKEFVSEIKREGFIFASNNGVWDMYGKIYGSGNGNKYNLEYIAASSLKDLFMLQYKPRAKDYSRYKANIKDSSYSYAYTFETHKYYENGTYRIGFDDNTCIISMFVALK